MAVMLAGCASVGFEVESEAEFAAAVSSREGAVRFADAAIAAAPGGDSVFWLLDSSQSALEARAAVFDAAAFTLDVQYFIWQDDPTGRFLLARLLAAADRGVRVRLLVDDISGSGRDAEFYALAEHANIEVRTFNAFRARREIFQAMEFFTRLGTLNHRMHIKTIVADGALGMSGGRNIGDRYFGIYDEFIQHDLDIMFAGAVLDGAIESFDEFWNASLAVPLRAYLKPGRMKLDLDGLRAQLDAATAAERARLAAFDLDGQQWLEDNGERGIAGSGSFIYDGAEVDSDSQHRIKAELYEFLAEAQEELLISVAYFIPDEELMTLLEDAIRRGVRVVLLTNSALTNNHTLAHVGYKRSRERVLGAGIELYELRPDAGLLRDQTVAPAKPAFLGLHTKAVSIDRRLAMVGTANLDPRALDINTESAVLIESAPLAEALAEQILESIEPINAWRLQLDSRGQVCWPTQPNPRCTEPVRGPLHRVIQFLHRLLPLEDQA